MRTRTIDLALVETGSGGDFQKVGNDLATVYGRENNVYIGLFGGNVEESTPMVDKKDRIANDYWANNLFYKNQPLKQYNSKTERTLNTTALNSAGRIKIENAVKDDLVFLTALGVEVRVNVTLPGINMVKIEVVTIYKDGEKRITIVEYSKKGTSSGDYSLQDYNYDYN